MYTPNDEKRRSITQKRERREIIMQMASVGGVKKAIC